MKHKLLAITLFLLVVSGLAVGQSILPTPNIVSSQIVTYVGPGFPNGFTASQNINTPYNVVFLVITCDLSNSGSSKIPCVGVDNPPTDQYGTPFTLIDYHFNTNSGHDWTEQEYYAVVQYAGTEVITFNTPVACHGGGCTWDVQVEQIQGILADELP
jgi:hypothetical protein